MKRATMQVLSLAFLLVGLTGAQPSKAQEVVRIGIGETLETAFRLADEEMRSRNWGDAWVGYSVPRTMYRNSRMGWFGGVEDRPTLEDLLEPTPAATGDVAVQEEARRALAAANQPNVLVEKEIAFLFERSGGRSFDMSIVSMDSGIKRGNRPIIWLGSREVDSSLSFIMELYDEAGRRDPIEELTAAIGMHDRHEVTIPFLTQAAMSGQSQDVRETAQFWLANAVVQKLQLLANRRQERTENDRVRRQALYALVNARDGDAVDLLVRLVQGDGDLALRREALLQLGHSDESEALDALVQLAGG